MKKILLFIALIIVQYGYSQNESSNFRLIEKVEHSDINYLTTKNINSIEHSYEVMLQNFKPIKGQFTTYVFIKEFYGISKFDEKESKFHDLIILKTDSNNIILDGYYYRLEWADVPSQYMIFRVFAENLILQNHLRVSDLKMLNEYEIYHTECSIGSRQLECCLDDKLEL